MSICCGQAAKAIRKVQRITEGYNNYLSGANKDLAQERIKVCQLPCEFYKRGLCTKCGCVIVVKTTVIEEHCPINKW